MRDLEECAFRRYHGWDHNLPLESSDGRSWLASGHPSACAALGPGWSYAYRRRISEPTCQARMRYISDASRADELVPSPQWF